MHRISGAVAAEPGLSTNAIERGVKGKNAAKREALRLLVAEGFIERRQDGSAHRFFPIRPFTEDDLAPSPLPRPNLAGANADAHLAPSPPSYRRGEARGEPQANGNSAEPRPLTEDTLVETVLREFPGSRQLV